MINIYSIGFTKKNARSFFEILKSNGIKKLIDVRLNNVSQLAGFAKRDDLEYFLNEICNIKYIHLSQFAPTKEILDDYKKKKISWREYENRYNLLLNERRVEKSVNINELDMSCFLCSEHIADQCHRRLAIEYLKSHYPEIEIVHL
jgi:uncharacterized protein (DUF488 family)